MPDDAPTMDFTALTERTAIGLLGIEALESTSERVVMRLPVTWKTHQPLGALHGGVSALLAETAASFGGAMSVPRGKSVVGIELNASHLRAARDGTVTAVATPLRKGSRIQVWGIEITAEDGRAVCSARCTLAVVDLPTG
jgi:1,4-dihydroxy-2-naphthoyl-CoA hydrolase